MICIDLTGPLQLVLLIAAVIAAPVTLGLLANPVPEIELDERHFHNPLEE